MRRQEVTITSVADSLPIPVDYRAQVFQIGFACVVSSGASLTYTVQHTFDDVFSPTFNPATATWFNHSAVVGETASKDGNYAFPFTAIRLSVSAHTSGSVTLMVIQSASRG